MSKGTLLIQEKTGRIFPWTQHFARRADMKPYTPADEGQQSEPQATTAAGGDDAGASAPAPEPARTDIGSADGSLSDVVIDDAIIVNGQQVSLKKASKNVLAEYAERHFGEKLDRRLAQESLAEQVRVLIARHGHPDAD